MWKVNASCTDMKEIVDEILKWFPYRQEELDRQRIALHVHQVESLQLTSLAAVAAFSSS